MALDCWQKWLRFTARETVDLDSHVDPAGRNVDANPEDGRSADVDSGAVVKGRRNLKLFLKCFVEQTESIILLYLQIGQVITQCFSKILKPNKPNIFS